MYQIIHEVNKSDFTIEQLKEQWNCDTVLRSGDKDYLARIIPDAEYEMVTDISNGK